jgi:hypothetical protein
VEAFSREGNRHSTSAARRSNSGDDERTTAPTDLSARTAGATDADGRVIEDDTTVLADEREGGM